MSLRDSPRRGGIDVAMFGDDGESEPVQKREKFCAVALFGPAGDSVIAKYGGYVARRPQFAPAELFKATKGVKKPLRGATVTYETGANIGGRTTLTRVGVGASVAGPVGAVVGGMFKKDRNRCYVTVEFPDGEIVVIDGPARDERKLREFAANLNPLTR